jgi:hypothetical protein
VTEEGPFEPALFTKTVGGKRKMTVFEREDRKGKGFHRGSAPGQLEYEEIPMTDTFREALARRIAEL